MDNSIKNRYEQLKTFVTKRKGHFEKLMDFMENETSWLVSPASTKYHLSREGGLLEHSVNVAETMLKIREALAPRISIESCVIVSLIHDFGKVGMPGKPQYLKNEHSKSSDCANGKKDSPYLFNKDLVYLSVPIRSLYLASKYIDLTEEVQYSQ